MKKFLFSLLLLIPLLSFSQNCTELQVTMFDSYGDGWNGNYFTVGDNSITLPFGSEGVDTICVNLDELKKELIELEKTLIEKDSLDWRDKKNVEGILNKQKILEEKIDKLK